MTTTLANYIALGSAGYTLGNLQAGGFAYKANADGGAAEITADQITVTPLLAPTGTFGLEFTAPWSVQTGQAQLSAITYSAPLPTRPPRFSRSAWMAASFRQGCSAM